MSEQACKMLSQNQITRRSKQMTIKQKQELIAEVVALLQAKLEADTVQPAPLQNASQKVEMLTIKECTEEIQGLCFQLRQLYHRI